MFDSILKRDTLPKPKYGAGLCIALSLHAAVLLWFLWPPARNPNQTSQAPEVILYQSLPQATHSLLVHAPPPPPPPSPPPAQPRELQRNKAKPFIKPAAVPAEKPLEKEPPATLAGAGTPTHPYSEKYGAEGGDPNTNFDPALHGNPGAIGSPAVYSLDVIPFGEGMLPPRLTRNHPIRFSREALEARVEGRALVRCTITTEGNVENCRFLQRLPHMDEAILGALYMRKYSPATYQGKKISVDYNIPIRLKLP
jgi:protein TonB